LASRVKRRAPYLLSGLRSALAAEADAKQCIAELKEERLRVEAELAALEEVPVPVALVHSVTIHPKGPRHGFEVKGKRAALVGGELFPQARYIRHTIIVGDAW
jgi:hypothetical protein